MVLVLLKVFIFFNRFSKCNFYYLKKKKPADLLLTNVYYLLDEHELLARLDNYYNKCYSIRYLFKTTYTHKKRVTQIYKSILYNNLSFKLRSRHYLRKKKKTF